VKYRELGSTGISVSVVAMGCWAIAGDWVWGEQDEQASIATIRTALDVGVNFFDTAEFYGDGYSETVLGKGLAGRRHEAVIASKVGPQHLSSDEVMRACERSLQRLGTDYIDLYQIHWPNHDIPIAETVGALETLRGQGKIRAFGVCNFGVRDLSEFLALSPCAADQLPYSLLWRGIEEPLQPMCVERGVGILCYSPLAQGLLTGKFASADDVPDGRARTRHFSKKRPLTRHGEDGCEAETFASIERIRRICARIEAPMAEVALAWAIHQAGVTAVLAGARTSSQITQNARAADLELAPEIVVELAQATDEVKRIMGTNLDQYESESRMR